MDESIKYDLDEKTLYIFTDWASRSVFNKKLKRKTWRHWWVWIWFIYYDKNFNIIEEDKSDYISYTNATNIDTELWAAVDWLKLSLKENLCLFKKIIVVTDCDFIHKNWINAVRWYRDHPWKYWVTLNWDPIKHKKKWKELAKYAKKINFEHKLKIDFEWIASHQKVDQIDMRIKWNHKADKSAVKWAQSINRVTSNNTSVRSRFFKEKNRFKGWFIPIYWEKILIHIYKSDHYRNKQYRYNYEVVSRDNTYYMKNWRLYYDKKTLRATYIYLVKIRSDWSNQIEKIYKEFSKGAIKELMISYWIDTSVLFWKLWKE